MGRSALLALLAFCLAAPESPAYLTKTANGNLVRWKAGSTAALWDDGTKTLSWSFNPIGFPHVTWPSTAQAGAAFQNALQTFEDVAGASINFRRLPDSSGTPSMNDGKMEMVLVFDESSDYFGTDITGSFALTYWSWNNVTGAMTDADIEFNGDPASFTWSTSGPPAPVGSNDIEVTQLHEGIHGVGGGHPVYYFASVWPTGRFPEDLMRDRCLAPDDRNLLRTLYGAAPGQGGTLSGLVNLSTGGGCELAIVVATDANGVPQATTTTSSSGAYSLNVPAGDYTLTAHHRINIRYNADINFGNADGFVFASTVAAAGVVDGGAVAAPAITATFGTPVLRYNRLTTAPKAFETQTQFLAKGSSGAIRLEITGATFTTAQIGTVDFGPGIVLGAATAAGGGGTTVVDVPFAVDVSATPGVRTIALTVSGERALLPSGLMVLDAGSLALATGGANPPSAGVAPGAADSPLLQFTLAAGPVEDVRVRRLQFDLAGSGPALVNVKLWRDIDGNGVVGGGDLRVFSGAAYAGSSIDETKAVAPPGAIVYADLALSVAAGNTTTLLLTADYPAAGSGDYTASIATSGITAHGMYYGSVITPSGGPVAGGTRTFGTLALVGLQQTRTTAGTPIATGGLTDETQASLSATVTAAVGTMGLEIEILPLGTPFSNTATLSSATTFASGTTISLNVTGLAPATAYHWQARPLSSVLPAGSWASFGGILETDADFAVDTSTTAIPTGLGQFASGGAAAIPAGGSVLREILLGATTGANSGGLQVALQTEVRPVGVAFSDVPTHTSAFGPGGAAASILFTGGTDNYRWQARTVNVVGGVSPWVLFDPALIHFHLETPNPIEADGGCMGRTSAVSGGSLLWLAGAALLLLRRRRAWVPLLLVGMAATAVAQEERLASLAAYAGIDFIDTDFEARGTDLVDRDLDGSGALTLGVEALIHLHEDWRIGAAVEVGGWDDVRLLSAGPVATWRFAGGEPEHWLKVGVLYRRLEVDQSGFGDFDPTLGLRVGYEMRIAVGRRWAVQLGLELRHSVWGYAEDVVTGDDQLGGTALFLSLGIAWLP